MKRLSILLVFLLVHILHISAQELFTLSGIVHKADGQTVSNVTLKIKGTNLLAVTDYKGYYILKNIPTGKHTLTVSSLEVKNKTFQIEISENRHDYKILVDAKNDRSIQEVAVQGKTLKKEIETSGFAVAVIETKEASLRNLTTNELLDRAVGVRVRQNGGEGAPIEYNLNGMSGSTIGIFLDGIEISTYGSSFNLNNIPPSMIERIEVYKGVLPSHLSGNYIGGAINVVMKKDASANNITASVSYGSFNTYRADLGGLYRNSKTGLTLRASAFYTHADNNYEMWGKFSKYTLPGGRLQRYYRVKRPNDKFESKGARFEIGFTDTKWADQLFLGYNISDSYKEIPHGITMTTPYFGRSNDYKAHVLSLNYNKRNLWLDGLSLTVNAVHSMRNTFLQDTVSREYNWDHTPIILNESGAPIYIGYKPGKGQQGDAIMSDIDRTITNIRSHLAYTIINGHRLSLNHKFESTTRQDKDLLIPERSDWITNNDLKTNIFALNYEMEAFNSKLRTNIFGKYGIYDIIQHIPSSQSDGLINYTKKVSSRNNKGFGGTLSYEFIDNAHLIFSAEKSFIMPTERHIYGEPENNLLANPDILPEMAVNITWAVDTLSIKMKNTNLAFMGTSF